MCCRLLIDFPQIRFKIQESLSWIESIVHCSLDCVIVLSVAIRVELDLEKQKLTYTQHAANETKPMPKTKPNWTGFLFFSFSVVVVVVAIFQKPKPKRILNVGEVVKNVANANAIEASRPVSGSRAEKHPYPVLKLHSTPQHPTPPRRTGHRARQPAKRIFSYKLEFRLGPN